MIKYVAVAKDATYTDAGATAAAGTSSIDAKVTGLPNTATAGVYLITYSAQIPMAFLPKQQDRLWFMILKPML